MSIYMAASMILSLNFCADTPNAPLEFSEDFLRCVRVRWVLDLGFGLVGAEALFG